MHPNQTDAMLNLSGYSIRLCIKRRDRERIWGQGRLRLTGSRITLYEMHWSVDRRRTQSMQFVHIFSCNCTHTNTHTHTHTHTNMNTIQTLRFVNVFIQTKLQFRKRKWNVVRTLFKANLLSWLTSRIRFVS